MFAALGRWRLQKVLMLCLLSFTQKYQLFIGRACIPKLATSFRRAKRRWFVDALSLSRVNILSWLFQLLKRWKWRVQHLIAKSTFLGIWPLFNWRRYLRCGLVDFHPFVLAGWLVWVLAASHVLGRRLDWLARVVSFLAQRFLRFMNACSRRHRLAVVVKAIARTSIAIPIKRLPQAVIVRADHRCSFLTLVFKRLTDQA